MGRTTAMRTTAQTKTDSREDTKEDELSISTNKVTAKPRRHTHIFTLGLVQHVSFLPLAVCSFIGLADVELHLGALLVLHGLPLVQGHLFRAFIFHFFHLVLPGNPAHRNVEP